MQSHNDYNFYFSFFSFCGCKFKCYGSRWYTVGKVFLRYITSPKLPKLSVGKSKKQICSCLATAEHGSQKNRNKKTRIVRYVNQSSKNSKTNLCMPKLHSSETPKWYKKLYHILRHFRVFPWVLFVTQISPTKCPSHYAPYHFIPTRKVKRYASPHPLHKVHHQKVAITRGCND